MYQKRRLFVGGSFPESNSELFLEFTRLLWSVCCDGFITELGKLPKTEQHNGDRLAVPSARFILGFLDHRLFLACINFYYKGWHWVSRRSLRWRHTDHVAISHRCRKSVEAYWSFWTTLVDSDHTSVRPDLDPSRSFQRHYHQTRMVGIRKKTWLDQRSPAHSSKCHAGL